MTNKVSPGRSLKNYTLVCLYYLSEKCDESQGEITYCCVRQDKRQQA